MTNMSSKIREWTTYSPPKIGGVAAPSDVRTARTGWSFWTDHPVCAFKGCLRRYFLDAQPPLLSQEGNTGCTSAILHPPSAIFSPSLRQIVNGIDALRPKALQKIPCAFTIKLWIASFDAK